MTNPGDARVVAIIEEVLTGHFIIRELDGSIRCRCDRFSAGKREDHLFRHHVATEIAAALGIEHVPEAVQQDKGGFVDMYRIRALEGGGDD